MKPGYRRFHVVRQSQAAPEGAGDDKGRSVAAARWAIIDSDGRRRPCRAPARRSIPTKERTIPLWSLLLALAAVVFFAGLRVR